MRLSGLQFDVLHLYRALLRTARSKDDSHGRLVGLVKNKFRDHALAIHKFDFKLIEHSLRWGYKQKKMMEGKGFSAASVVK